MKKVYLLVITSLFAIAGYAQTAEDYVFSKSTETFTDISGLSGTTSTTGLSSDDTRQTGIPIGFTFSYCGTDYTQLSACSNGWISLANSTSSTYSNSSGNISGISGGVGLLLPFWDDLSGSGKTAYYRTEGTTPSRVFTFQYGRGSQGWGLFSGSSTACFQIKLYETTGVIEFAYGSPSYSSRTGTIGICNSTSDYQTLSSHTATSASTTFYTGVSNSPSPNTLFTWSPPCSAPEAITGTDVFCVGGGTTLSNATPDGTWSSASTGIATVDENTGVVVGVSSGVANISYITGSGPDCYAVFPVTVNEVPSLSSASNNSPICEGETLTFASNSPANITGYSWTGPGTLSGSTTASPTIAGVTTAANGVYTVTINNGTGDACTATYTTTVNIDPLPAAISGATDVCLDASTVLSSATSGGSWSSSTATVASVDGSGVVSGLNTGTANISYTLPTSCLVSTNINVRPLPVLTIGPSSSATVCLNSPATFTAVSAGSSFLWSGVSGASGLSCIACATTTITPTSEGTRYYNVTATTTYGCETSGGVSIVVNPLPGDIAGLLNTCVGTTSMLSNEDAGGTWNSNNVAVASVNSATGLVTAISVGTATISYTLPTGCVKTAVVNVTSAPPPISGTAQVCSSMSTNLSHSTAGGVWSSSSSVIASVNSSGVVTGGSAGNATITYTLPSGCMVTITATVNALPAAISGASALCESETTTLSNSDAGGTWSSSSANASVGMFSGVVSGNTAGSATISYTLSNGCYQIHPMIVNTLPAPISGDLATCYNTISILTDATFGGVWSSGNPTIASIDPSGLVTGLGTGTSTMSYTMSSTGCRATAVFTVNALPSEIIGVTNVCKDAVTTLSNADAGGAWSSSNTTVASVDGSGDVTGVSAGNATVTYTLPTGCRKTVGVLVNPLPLPITGSTTVCQEGTATLYDFTPGGVWESGAPALASIDGSGVVSGHTVGPVNISYTLPTGCRVTSVITVNERPSAITGSLSVCSGQSTLLSSSPAGGVWSSSNPGNVSAGASTGIMTGVSGNAAITYALPSGCNRTVVMNVNPLPSNITGAAAVCVNSAITLNNGTAVGAWSSSDVSIATVDGSGVVTGMSSGVVIISYTLLTGCYRTKTITVNDLPAIVSGSTEVCHGQNTTLSSATTGGVWSTASAGIASVTSSGVVTGNSVGSTNIIYTSSTTGCARVTGFDVNPLPAAITGISNVCVLSTTTLSNLTSGGIWSSSDDGIAGISSGGVVTGNGAGVATITYSLLSTGCIRTRSVNVNPLPESISGDLNVCVGATTALGNGSPAGVWSSSSTGTASINSAGVVTGVSAGTANVTYTLPTSCMISASVVVNPLPSDISGSTSVCEGSSTQLSNGTINGTWNSSDNSVATISATGNVSGAIAGSAIITYTLPTGCYKTESIVVNPLPAPITGNNTVCQGLVTGMSNASGGGSWSSSNAGIAPVSGAGVVTGVAAGVAAITYTLPTGCLQTKTLVVNPIPSNITGTASVCVEGRTMLTTATGGGFWGSASPFASVSYLGEVTGISAGTATITYMLPSGCRRTRVVTVNPLPAVIAGASNVCEGSEIVLSSSTLGGVWQSNSVAHATIDGVTGQLSGIDAGSVLISYTLPTGCMRTRLVTVNSTPSAIAGPMEICDGGIATLTTPTTGGVWISDNTSVATIGLVGGNVTGISAGVAHIRYSMPTGCSSMATFQVNPQPAAISGLLSICEGSSTVLSNVTLGGMWSSNLASVADITSAGVVSGTSAGNATISYTLPTGCYTIANLVVNSLPEVYSLTGGGTYCAGGGGVSVGLDGSSPLTSYKLYKGSTLLGTYSGTGAPIYFGMYTGAGIYTVSGVNSAGCSRDMSSSAVVSVTPVVTPFVNVTSDLGDTVCAGTAVTYGAVAVNGGSSPSYEWKVNGMTVATGGDSYVYSPVSGDIVSVRLNSSVACAIPAIATASKAIEVMSVETPSVNISVSPSTSICAGTAVMYSASVMNGGDRPTYSWRKNGSTPIGTGATLSYMPNDNDNITCWLNSSYRCLAVNNVVSNGLVMQVDEVFVPEVSITVTPGTTVVQGEAVSFSATVVNAGPSPSYQWLRNGVAISGANMPVYTTKNLSDGDMISCSVKGSGVCGETSKNEVTMTVTESTAVGSLVTVGYLRLVPNPNMGTFVIRGSIEAGVTEPMVLEVTDMLGQVVYRGELEAVNGVISKQITLDNGIANGMYLLNVADAMGGKNTIRFVVQQ